MQRCIDAHEEEEEEERKQQKNQKRQVALFQQIMFSSK